MGIFSGWFTKNKPEDYEQVLASLSLDIQKRQTRLSEIRLRERRATLLFSVYALASWVAYLSLWYLDVLPNISNHPRRSKYEKTLKGVPVFVGPIIILFIRRIVQIWYTRKGDHEEKHLVALRKQQREKIEQIKKQTNYYTTRNLLERYDDVASVADSPLRRRPVAGQSPIPSTPQRPPQLQQGLVTPRTPAPSQISPNLQQQLSPSPPRPIPPLRKQWYDKLADAILGDDDTSVSTAASRYALICQKCFAHNGLVMESVWEDTQYVCPKCGHFNPSARSLRQARLGNSSSRSSATPPPTTVPANGSAPPISQPIHAELTASTSVSPTSAPPEGGQLRRRQSRTPRDGEEEDVTEGASVHMDVDS